MTLKELTTVEYQQFVQEAQQNSFLQTVEMSKLLKTRNYTIKLLGLDVDGQLQIVALMHQVKVFGGWYMEISGGPVSRSPKYLKQFYEALKQYAKQNNAIQLMVRPEDVYQTFDQYGNTTSEPDNTLVTLLTELHFKHDGFQATYDDSTDWIFVKDLTNLTKETLVSSFDKKGKLSIKKSEKFNVKVRQLTKEELPLFKAITNETAKRQGFPDKSLEYYQYFFDAFQNNAEFMVASLNSDDYKSQLNTNQMALEKEIAQLELEINEKKLSYTSTKNNQLKLLKKQLDALLVRQMDADALIEKFGHGDIVIAASLFVYTPTEVVYFCGGSYKELSKFDGAALLQKYAMERALHRNIHRYNFLGIAGTFDGSDGVLRFKQRFNGFIIRKNGVFRYYPRPLKHAVIQCVKKLMKR